MRDLSTAQAKQVIDAEHHYLALADARRLWDQDYHGGMHWKRIAGKDYLYRTLDRHGKARSLGPRSEETERIHEEFHRRKGALKERIASLEERCEMTRRVNAAMRVGSAPVEVVRIAERLDQAGLMEHGITIIGTNAMHVYESMAGVRFDPDIMATVDVDLLWNHKTKLSLGAKASVSEAGMLGLLKQVDRSFEIRSDQPFRAQANNGYMVDLIRQMPDPPWADEPDRFFEDDLVATDIWNMKWLLGAPRVTQVVIGADGSMARMTAPDPRAFVMFKLWLSQADDREPQKKLRDAAQAQAVIHIIEDKLPHLAAHWRSLHSFPQDVVDRAVEEVERVRMRGAG